MDPFNDYNLHITGVGFFIPYIQQITRAQGQLVARFSLSSKRWKSLSSLNCTTSSSDEKLSIHRTKVHGFWGVQQNLRWMTPFPCGKKNVAKLCAFRSPLKNQASKSWQKTSASINKSATVHMRMTETVKCSRVSLKLRPFCCGDPSSWSGNNHLSNNSKPLWHSINTDWFIGILILAYEITSTNTGVRFHPQKKKCKSPGSTGHCSSGCLQQAQWKQNHIDPKLRKNFSTTTTTNPPKKKHQKFMWILNLLSGEGLKNPNC